MHTNRCIFDIICIMLGALGIMCANGGYVMRTAIRRVYKQLLDEAFVISRIIEVEVGVISRSRRLRLITLTETSIILNITKTESNNRFIIH